MSRSRLAVDERREQLVSLALELFSNKTYDEISIDEIAKAAGISKGLLYHYFPSKRAFYIAALERAAEDLLVKTEIEGHSGAQSPDDLREATERYLTFAEEHDTQYTFILRGGMAGDPQVQAIVNRIRDRFYERIMEGLNTDDPKLRTAVRGYIGFVEAASLAWLDQRELSRTELGDLLVQVFVGTVGTLLQAT